VNFVICFFWYYIVYYYHHYYNWYCYRHCYCLQVLFNHPFFSGVTPGCDEFFKSKLFGICWYKTIVGRKCPSCCLANSVKALEVNHDSNIILSSAILMEGYIHKPQLLSYRFCDCIWICCIRMYVWITCICVIIFVLWLRHTIIMVRRCWHRTSVVMPSNVLKKANHVIFWIYLLLSV